ncbi:hypothetical protein, partial [Prevotella nigrescens]|uniref:hypothetical protein n=1 Tax=Prevotella nigrescens TaxID=28133 RepID=UPI002880BB36
IRYKEKKENTYTLFRILPKTYTIDAIMAPYDIKRYSITLCKGRKKQVLIARWYTFNFYLRI